MGKKYFKSKTSTSPLSAAVLCDNTLYISGQMGIVPETGAIISDDVAEQTEQAINNLSAVLSMASMTLDDIVKTLVFISDTKDFAKMNQMYSKCFGENLPARSCVKANFPKKGVKVEIEAVAVK